MDSMGKLRHVDDPESTRFLSDPDLLDTGPDGGERLPVSRLLIVLYLAKLIAGLAPRQLRKGAKVCQRSCLGSGLAS